MIFFATHVFFLCVRQFFLEHKRAAFFSLPLTSKNVASHNVEEGGVGVLHFIQ